MAVAVSLGLVTGTASAAQANATWTGASASPEWSDPANWTGTPPASNTPSQTLTFPTLKTSCGTCYTSHNGLTGVSVLGLVFRNTSGGYQILGNSLIVGSNGVSDTPGGGTSTAINAPLVLSSPQTWSIGSGASNGYNVLTLLGGITGSSGDALTVAFPAVHEADLFVDSDMEVGPVTVSGAGGLHIGSPTKPGSVNGTDGQPVTLTGTTLVANPGSTAGPLSLSGGMLLLGTNPQNNGTTTLHVDGAISLGSSTATRTFLNDNGSTAGTGFSQLSAAGNIALGGQLIVGQGPSNGTCAALEPGDVATLITTAGTLSGTFANAPEGATLTMASTCQRTPAQIRIGYTANSVTATVLGSPGPTPPKPKPKPSRTKKRRGRLLGPRGRLTVIRRSIRVTETCRSSVPCRGQFSLAVTVRARGHKKRAMVRCARARFRIRAHRSATLRVKLTAACLRLLRAQRHHRLTVIYTSRPQSGVLGEHRRITLVLRTARRRPRR